MIYMCSLESDTAKLLDGYEVVTDLAGAYRALFRKDCEELQFTDEFIEEYMTPTGIIQFKTEAERFNPRIKVKMSQKWVTIFDKSALFLKTLTNLEDVINYALNNREEFMRLFHHMIDTFTSQYYEALTANNKLAVMHLLLAAKDKAIEAERATYEVNAKSHEETLAKFETLVSRINYTYNKDLDADKLLGINIETNQYRRILYVKEVTRVHYTDTLLYYLRQILLRIYNQPVRAVVIEAPFAYERARLYPMFQSHLHLTYNDVYVSDIFMAGMQSELMKDILKNPSNLDFLIILDRSGWREPYVTGHDVVTVYTASTIDDVWAGTDTDMIISYTDQTMYIPHIPGFDDYPLETKLSKYSSMAITQRLQRLLEDGM